MADEQISNNSVGDKFRGLPIEDLIAAPLKAVCESQKQLALSAFDFMTQIGFEEGGSARLLKFDLERPLSEGGTSKIAVQAPFLGLVPIPSLLVSEVNIDFQMEVTDTDTSTSKSAKEASLEASFTSGFIVKASAKIAGKVSSSRENTRSTNQTAKYQIHVSARQQQPTEGLGKLMDIMASCVDPITTAPAKP